MVKSDAPAGQVFPCEIDVKVFLKARDNNLELVRDVLLKTLDQDCVMAIRSRQSKHGKYESFSCKLYARSREQMDRLFQVLTAHPEVLMVI